MRHHHPRVTRIAASLSVLALTAACGTASGGGADQGAPYEAPGSAASYATTLLNSVTPPGGAHRVGAAPVGSLGQPPESSTYVSRPVVLHRWWTVDRPLSDVQAWLARHAASLQSDGSGSTSSGSGNDLHYRVYEARTASLPTRMAFGRVYVEAVALSAGKTALAAYAVALRQPPRPAAEHVPTPDKVIVGWRLAPGGTPVLKTLTGAQAAALTRRFNTLPRAISTTLPCPMQPANDQVTVTFTAAHHTWRTVVAQCPGITVTRDGHGLPILQASPGYLSALKALGVRFGGGGGGVIPLNEPATSR